MSESAFRVVSLDNSALTRTLPESKLMRWEAVPMEAPMSGDGMDLAGFGKAVEKLLDVIASPSFLVMKSVYRKPLL